MQPRRSWQHDKLWSDQHIALTKRYLAAALFDRVISIGTDKEDQEENTDLRIATLGSTRIACRIRKPSPRLDYYRQFTIRASRPSGARTEYQKVMAGWGDYIFYGWINEVGDAFDACVLGDLMVFRSYVWDHYQKYRVHPGELIPNVDGSSQFRAFDIEALPPSFVVKRKVHPNLLMNAA